MASSGAPKLSIDDILTFSEAELVQYMKQNHRPDGGFELEFEGWENLPKDERDQLAERLMIGAQKANDEGQSCPIDLDQVAARLNQISHDQDAVPQALSRPARRERSPTVEINWDEVRKNREIIAFNDLVKDGGRPAYPINLIEQVSEDPEAYREMLRPWQEYPNASTPDWTEVFRKQLKRWQDFRNWQEDNRGIYDAEKGYLAFFEETKREYQKDGLSQWLSELEADSSYLKSEWENMQRVRKWNRYWLREDHGHGGFLEYAEEFKRRLAQHSFTRIFQLDEDPTRQDKLTTWIEYLNYEYSWYDRYSRSVQRLQPEYDEAWKRLVDSGVLRPSETDEYLRTTESSFRSASEREQAEKAVDLAEVAAKAALRETEKAKFDPPRSSVTKQDRIGRLATTHSMLVAAKNSLKSIKRREDLITGFIRGTWNYETAKKNVESHEILLEWILEQVPLVESELNESKAAEDRHDNHNQVTHDRRSTKRKRSDLNSLFDETSSSTGVGETSKRSRRDNTSHDQPLKQLTSDVQNSNSHDPIAMKTSNVTTNRPPLSTNISQSSAISQQLRRSTRIAARQDLAGTTVAPPRTVENTPRRSHRKVAQASAPSYPLGRKTASQNARRRRSQSEGLLQAVTGVASQKQRQYRREEVELTT